MYYITKIKVQPASSWEPPSSGSESRCQKCLFFLCQSWSVKKNRVSLVVSLTIRVYIWYPLLSNIAIENGPFIDDLWWFTYSRWWFSIEMLNNQRVYIWIIWIFQTWYIWYIGIDWSLSFSWSFLHCDKYFIPHENGQVEPWDDKISVLGKIQKY